MSGPELPGESQPDVRILCELGDADQVFALVAESAPEPRLGWLVGNERRVAEDVQTPSELVGVTTDVPIVVSGVETHLERNVTVAEAIDAYGALLLARLRRTLGELHELDSSEDPCRRHDPASIEPNEGKEQAAEEVIRHSLEGIFAFGRTVLSLGDTDGTFYDEIRNAAVLYPDVVLDLLYEGMEGPFGRAT